MPGERAKALQEGFKLAGQSPGKAPSLDRWLSKVFGTIPEDLIGMALGDALHFKRAENIIVMAAKSSRHLKDVCIEMTQGAPLSIGIRLLAAAVVGKGYSQCLLWVDCAPASRSP